MFLEYVRDHEAFTIGVASSQTGIDSNKLYRYTTPFLNMGVLVKAGKLGKGSVGSPAIIYALRDASKNRVGEAAQLYKDVTNNHVTSLDDYTIKSNEETYRRVAEEAIMKHRDEYGVVKLRSVQEMLNALNLRGEDHRAGVHRTLLEMGYEVVS